MKERISQTAKREKLLRIGLTNSDIHSLFFAERLAKKMAKKERESSRFIFMHGNDIKMLGNWHELDGVFYSNMNWAGYRYHYGNATHWRFGQCDI